MKVLLEANLPEGANPRMFVAQLNGEVDLKVEQA